MLRHYGLKAGSGVFISSGCRFAHPDLSNITLGENVFLNHGCFLENGGAIKIMDKARIGPHAKILTTTHAIAGHENRAGSSCIRSLVMIGKGVWIGASAVILPGVTIGNGCVIGAGAVVNRDCEPDGLYVGMPARRKLDLRKD